MDSLELKQTIRDLHREKSQLYGNAWKKRGEVLGILANLARKVDRLEAMRSHPAGSPDESWLDTSIDLLVYALKHQTFLADIDPPVRQILFGETTLVPPFSDGVAGFDHLLARQEFHSQGTAVELGPAISKQFSRLEACYNGLQSGSSAVKRLQENRALVAFTSALVIALAAQSPIAPPSGNKVKYSRDPGGPQ